MNDQIPSSYDTVAGESFVPRILPLKPSTTTSDLSPPPEGVVSTYDDWQPLGRGPDGLAFQARRRTNGEWVELHVIRPIAQSVELTERLERRRRLIELCATSMMRRIIDLRLDEASSLLVVERPCNRNGGDRTLADALQANEQWDRLGTARELLVVVRRALRVGLFHGHLSAGSIILDAQHRIRIDYSAVNSGTASHSFDATWSFAKATELGELEDLLSLKDLIGQLLGEEAVDLTALPARSRAALRSLLRSEVRDEASVPSLTKWESILGVVRVAPLPDDPHGTVEQAPVARDRLSNEPVSSSIDAGIESTCELLVAPKYPDESSESTLPGATPAEAISEREGMAHTRPVLEVGMMIGRYRLEQKLGQGGMGIVYLGTDLSDESRVAIKILYSRGSDSAQALRRFHKEARLLAGVQNDYVTRLLEVGEDNGAHFIAMEYVEGTTLKHWLASSGPLDEKTSLGVVSDIARGLMEAHAKGIVHRDIKPENVLLKSLDPSSDDLRTKRIKLSDFGIARQVEQSASMEVTQAGAFLGTPLYMSPEQCRGTHDIGPQTDVYSLGITLYELLCGSPPYTATDAFKLAAMHLFEPVPAIQKKMPTVSDLTAQVISRALAKDPGERFADASQMLASLQRILRGESRDFEMHPKMPSHHAKALWEKTFSWDLQSTPDQLWPLVSNTERLNRAIGLPPVSYRTENDAKLGLRKFGTFKLVGVQVAWEEHPFEWVEGVRMGILREFSSGPFKWFMSIVELTPLAGGGTRLTHQIRIERSNWIGRILTTLEADWRGGKNLDRVYRRIDQAIQKKLVHEEGADAFESLAQPKKAQTDRIKQRSDKLLERGVDAEVVEKLTEFIATAPPQVVAQIRPLPLAAQLSVDSDELLKACLFAASEGLLVIRWEILCPTCRVSATAESLLSSIKEHTHCVACDYDFRSDLGEAIELVFRAHPEIREVDDAIYCIGGPEHSPHVVAQVRLEAGERVELELKLDGGDYLVRGPRLVGQQRFRVRALPAPSMYDLAVSELGKNEHTPVVRSGIQLLTITNDLDHVQVIRVERMVPRDDVVTATRASTLALFRELFPDQVLGQNRPIAADEMTLVATTVFDIESLYATLGDRAAYEMIGRHLEVLRACVASHRGTIAKTVGEGMLAAFVDCEHAVEAALRLQASIDEEPELRFIRLSIGVHRGKVLVATMNERLDYFGATARTVGALPDAAEGGIVLSEAVFADPEVQALLAKRGHVGTVEELSLSNRNHLMVQRVVISRVVISRGED
jgi:serine/threonine protein kinase/class 3 adenylate cyclase